MPFDCTSSCSLLFYYFCFALESLSTGRLDFIHNVYNEMPKKCIMFYPKQKVLPIMS